MSLRAAEIIDKQTDLAKSIYTQQGYAQALCAPKAFHLLSVCSIFHSILQARSAAMEFGAVENAMNPEFYRLRWSVFEDVSNIRVVDDMDSPHPELLPFEGHPIAKQLPFKLPLQEIPILITPLTEWENPTYKRPEALRVRRADGGAVTVADVVEQLSGYLIKYKGDMHEATHLSLLWKDTETSGDGTRVNGLSDAHEDPITGPYEYSTETRAFFNGFGDIEVGDAFAYVDLWIEGQYGESFENFWKERPSEEALLDLSAT